MTQPNREKWAAENVSRQNHEFYLPMFLSRQGSETSIKPLFRPYLFVKINQSWAWLTGTYGVSRIIMGEDGGPAHLADQIIAGIKAREGKDGLVQLTAHVDGGFKLGEQLRVNSGPMLGFVGVYDSSSDHERETILMECLGRKTPVIVEKRRLERVNGNRTTEMVDRSAG